MDLTGSRRGLLPIAHIPGKQRAAQAAGDYIEVFEAHEAGRFDMLDTC